MKIKEYIELLKTFDPECLIAHRGDRDTQGLIHVTIIAVGDESFQIVYTTNAAATVANVEQLERSGVIGSDEANAIKTLRVD